jgi:hypothetical protein
MNGNPRIDRYKADACDEWPVGDKQVPLWTATMPSTQDIEYFLHRERQERTLADRAPSANGRRIHLELARRYARMIDEARTDYGPGDGPGDRRPTLRIAVPH